MEPHALATFFMSLAALVASCNGNTMEVPRGEVVPIYFEGGMCFLDMEGDITCFSTHESRDEMWAWLDGEVEKDRGE